MLFYHKVSQSRCTIAQGSYSREYSKMCVARRDAECAEIDYQQISHNSVSLDTV